MNDMADVQPLRGIRYANETVGDPAQVVTPPYDVITKEAQATYYARNPYNFIRLELGQEAAKDSTLNNRYTRAAITYAGWRKNGVLRQNLTPDFYLYQQLFTHNNRSYTPTILLAPLPL